MHITQRIAVSDFGARTVAQALLNQTRHDMFIAHMHLVPALHPVSDTQHLPVQDGAPSR